MSQSKLWLLSGLIVLFLCSCKDRTTFLGDIDCVKIELDQEKSISLWDICSGIELVPLETTDSALLSIVYPTIYQNHYFLRQNNPQEVVCFDSVGHFLHKIGRQGRAADEYKSLNCVAVNPYTSELYLGETLDDMNVYDLEGKFLEKVSFDSIQEVIHGMIPLNRDTLLIVSGRGGLTFTFYSLKMRQVIAQKRDRMPGVGKVMPFFRIAEKVYYYPTFENVLYEVQDTSFVPVLQLDFGQYNNPEITNEPVKQNMSKAELENFIGKYNTLLVTVSGNATYLYLTLVRPKENWKKYYVWLNRSTKEYRIFGSFKEQVSWSIFDCMENKEFVSMLYPTQKEELDVNLLDARNKEIYNRLEVEDNPVIVRFKLK